MKPHVLALALWFGCSSPAKPAPQPPAQDPVTPAPTAKETPPPSRDLPATPAQPDPEVVPDAPPTGQAKLAADANDAGVKLMLDHKFKDASDKFRDAAVRSPQALYYFNLCSSLYQEGKFGEALTACNAIAKTNPKPELTAKADQLAERIKADAKAQKIELK